MKRSVIILSFLLTALLFSGCIAGKPMQNDAEGPASATKKNSGSSEIVSIDRYGGAEECYVEDWSLTKAIECTSVIFEGLCEGINFTGRYGIADMQIRAVNVIRGGLEAESVVPVRTNDGEMYREGVRYLIFANPLASVYEEKDLYYHEVAVVFDDSGSVYCSDMPDTAGLAYDEIVARTASLVKEYPYQGSEGVMGAYCTSDDIEMIAEYADCVLKVRASSIAQDIAPDRTTYLCTVLECLSGEAEESIRAVAAKNGLDIGEEYLLLLMKSEDSNTYTLASLKGVIPADSPEAELIIKIFR